MNAQTPGATAAAPRAAFRPVAEHSVRRDASNVRQMVTVVGRCRAPAQRCANGIRYSATPQPRWAAGPRALPLLLAHLKGGWGAAMPRSGPWTAVRVSLPSRTRTGLQRMTTVSSLVTGYDRQVPGDCQHHQPHRCHALHMLHANTCTSPPATYYLKAIPEHSIKTICGLWAPSRSAGLVLAVSGSFALAWLPASCTAWPWRRMSSPSAPVRRATNLVVGPLRAPSPPNC
jgi:hypothetical protein